MYPKCFRNNSEVVLNVLLLVKDTFVWIFNEKSSMGIFFSDLDTPPWMQGLFFFLFPFLKSFTVVLEKIYLSMLSSTGSKKRRGEGLQQWRYYLSCHGINDHTKTPGKRSEQITADHQTHTAAFTHRARCCRARWRLASAWGEVTIILTFVKPVEQTFWKFPWGASSYYISFCREVMCHKLHNKQTCKAGKKATVTLVKEHIETHK